MASDDKSNVLSDLEKLKAVPVRDEEIGMDDDLSDFGGESSNEDEDEAASAESKVQLDTNHEESPASYRDVLSALKSAEQGEDLALRNNADILQLLDVVEVPMVAEDASNTQVITDELEPNMYNTESRSDFPYESFQFAEESSSNTFAPTEQVYVVEDNDMEIESDDEFGLLAEDELDEDDDIPVSYNNALILNENYQQDIRVLIENLEEALRENEERQASLTAEIESFSPGIPVCNHKKQRENSVIARNPLTVYYAPYFKDVNLYTHPPNEDTLRKRANGELDLYLINPRELNDTEKSTLVVAVREDAIDKRLKSLIEEEKHVLSQMRIAGLSKADKDGLRARLRKLISQETDIKSLTDDLLFDNVDEEYDWLKITAQAFNRTISPESCRLMWKNHLHPLVNTGKWTRQEDKMLKELVSNPDEDGLVRPRKDWDKISTQLGTNRNAFLCFARYQTKHNKACDNRRWTQAEDDRLRELVRQCRINRFVPWNKVAYYMHNRTKDQCYQRYMYSLRDEVRQGLFEEVEDYVIIVGVKLFGTDWMRISHFIPNRTPMQIHSRYNTFLKANFDNWTQDEDCRLLNAVKTTGNKDWKSIAKLFDGRTRSQCRQRFYYIFKTYQKSSHFSLQQLPYHSEDSKRKIHQEELYRRLDAKVEEFLKNNAVCRSTLELSDDDDDDTDEEGKNVDGLNFSFNPAKNFHITPEGERIPMKALLEFMRQLGSDLPKPPKVNQPLARNVGLLKSKFTTVDRDGNLRSSALVPIADSATVSYMNSRYGKLFISTWPSRQGREKEVYRTVKDVKVVRQVGRTFCNILQASYLYSNGPQCDMLLQDTLRKANECKENRRFERQKQFLEILRAKSQDGVICKSPQVLVCQQTSRPVIKTYSRKSKQKSAFKPTNSSDEQVLPPSTLSNVGYLKFIAPNLKTLVGLRSLLLRTRTLKENTKKFFMPSSSKIEILKAPFRDPVFFGIRRSDPRSLSNESKNGRLSAQEAERRLRDRFLSLFFWPAVMATIRPNERKDVFDMNEEDEVVAASNPMDVSAIIEDAKTKVASAPRVVVVRKRKAIKPIVIATGDEVAPPPIKKRILAEEKSAMSQDELV